MPTGLAFDSNGTLFESDYGSHQVYKFAPNMPRTIFATSLHPWGLAFDSAGNLFEADFDTGNINKFTPDGTPQGSFATGLNSPVGLVFNNTGYLFAGDYNALIYKYAPDVTVTTFSSGISVPQGLAFDSAGNLFVASYGSGNIYKIGGDGIPTVFANVSGNPVFIAIQPPAPSPPYVAHLQAPINADGSSIFTVRRGIVPVKFSLTLNGNPTCDLPAATIVVTRTAGGTLGAIDESVYTGAADIGSNFRIDSCQYVYNLSASALGVGTYRVDIMINGQAVGSGIFQLK